MHLHHKLKCALVHVCAYTHSKAWHKFAQWAYMMDQWVTFLCLWMRAPFSLWHHMHKIYRPIDCVAKPLFMHGKNFVSKSIHVVKDTCMLSKLVWKDGVVFYVHIHAYRQHGREINLIGQSDFDWQLLIGQLCYVGQDIPCTKWQNFHMKFYSMWRIILSKWSSFQREQGNKIIFGETTMFVTLQIHCYE